MIRNNYTSAICTWNFVAEQDIEAPISKPNKSCIPWYFCIYLNFFRLSLVVFLMRQQSLPYSN